VNENSSIVPWGVQPCSSDLGEVGIFIVGWALPTLSSNSRSMSEYRRNYIQGGTFFLTLVTYQRIPLFSSPENIHRLRVAIAKTRKEMPLDIMAAVVLPDHIHFLWTLPDDDFNYSKRVGRLKVLFTRSLRGEGMLPQNVST